MSKIKLTGHASGSGVLTIAAPNTDSDRTITLPDVTGTLLDSGSDLPAANLTGSVAAARIASNTIDSAHITAGAIDDAHLATGISASKLTGALPAISGAALTGLSASDSTKLPLAGGTMTGSLAITTASTVDTVVLTRGTTSHNNMFKFKTGSSDKWIVGQRNDSTDHFRFYSYGTSSDVLSILTDGKVGIGTTSPTAKLEIAGASNTVGSTQLIRLGESAFRVMTGGEQHVLCLDRDNNGGTKKIMQSWNPDSGSVAVGNTGPVDAGMLAIKPISITQAQLKLMGGNYSYGTELHSQNGSESGTVGNTRQFFKIEHVTLGSTRTMYTTSSQIGTDTHKWETQNLTRMFLNTNGKLDRYGPNGSWMNQMWAGGTGVQYFIDFRLQNNSQVGYIMTNGSSTSYNTSSDYRLKENVVAMTNATTRLKQLQPKQFNFIADETNTLVDGFIAHEVSSIVPEAVTGTKDGMTAEVLYVEADDLPEGKNVGDVKEASVPDMQGIDQSKLVPLLVKTIQELEARITAGGL